MTTRTGSTAPGDASITSSTRTADSAGTVVSLNHFTAEARPKLTVASRSHGLKTIASKALLHEVKVSAIKPSAMTLRDDLPLSLSTDTVPSDTKARLSQSYMLSKPKPRFPSLVK